MNSRRIALKLLVPCLAGALAAAAAQSWKPAQRGYEWSFPRDHWSHPGYRTEWWYVTGHLQADSAPENEFGFQFTFFRIGLEPDKPALDSEWAAANLIMGHAALADFQRGRHLFSEVLYRETPFLGEFGSPPDPLIAWSLGPAGTSRRWQLSWNGQGFDFNAADLRQNFELSLSAVPQRDLVFQGPGGFSAKTREGDSASHYYSFTRLETEGRLSLDGRDYKVSGLSWMDHEFGSSFLSSSQVGWDWFSLQLEDGRDIMLFQLRDQEGRPDHVHATVVQPGGRVLYPPPQQWDLRPTGIWTSEESGARYPAGWILRLAEDEYVIRPRLADQENRSRLRPGLSYWEGAVQVENGAGRRVGRGYVELTGYAGRLPL